MEYGNWVKNAESVIFTGKTGVEKIWMACAIANKACRMGYTIRHERIPRLLEELYVAHADGSYPRLMNRLAKIDVLIIGTGDLIASESVIFFSGIQKEPTGIDPC